LDDLFEERKITSDIVILPSLLSWMSSELTAETLINLALSTQENIEVIFTFPTRDLLQTDARSNLRKLGFELERVLVLT